MSILGLDLARRPCLACEEEAELRCLPCLNFSRRELCARLVDTKHWEEQWKLIVEEEQNAGGFDSWALTDSPPKRAASLLKALTPAC